MTRGKLRTLNTTANRIFGIPWGWFAIFFLCLALVLKKTYEVHCVGLIVIAAAAAAAAVVV